MSKHKERHLTRSESPVRIGAATSPRAGIPSIFSVHEIEVLLRQRIDQEGAHRQHLTQLVRGNDGVEHFVEYANKIGISPEEQRGIVIATIKDMSSNIVQGRRISSGSAVLSDIVNEFIDAGLIAKEDAVKAISSS